VDMPVFFYIDPAINNDRRCGDVDHIALSYTFFALKNDDEEEEQDEQQPSTVLQHERNTAASSRDQEALQRS
jgi:cytochrome c oxidase assembly protein Cox11